MNAPASASIDPMPREVPMAGARAERCYDAERLPAWAAVEGTWTGGGTPFQSRHWLASWYDAFATRADIEPILVQVRDRQSGEIALRLPLMLHRQAGSRLIEFADLNVTDFNAPLLGPAAPTDRAEAAGAMRAVRKVLPPADLLRFTKMPPMIDGRPNPLALLFGAVPCALNGNLVQMGDCYDAWRQSLGRTYRKELERSWRVFSRADEAAFTRLVDRQQATATMSVLEAQQGKRMRSLGNAYVLDDPVFSRVYQNLIDRGIDDGSTIMTTLTAEGEVVASLLGLRQADTYIMIRISQAGGRWTNCSPGRLIIERTLAMLHAEGCRTFDFSVGNYDYKRRFKVTPTPLVDYIAPLALRGVPAAVRAGLVGRLRRYPSLDRRLRDMRARLGSKAVPAQDKNADAASSDDARQAS